MQNWKYQFSRLQLNYVIKPPHTSYAIYGAPPFTEHFTISSKWSHGFITAEQIPMLSDRLSIASAPETLENAALAYVGI